MLDVAGDLEGGASVEYPGEGINIGGPSEEDEKEGPKNEGGVEAA